MAASAKGRIENPGENADTFLYKKGGTQPTFLLFSYVYGTGSYPLPPQGGQRDKRLTVSHNPFNGPYLRSASSAYWEQVGVNRHEGGSNGEMHNW